MQQIRQALRGSATVLMGKNTRIRKVGGQQAHTHAHAHTEWVCGFVGPWRVSDASSGGWLTGRLGMPWQVMGQFIRKNPGHPIEQLLPAVGGNVGFVFTNGDLGKIREVIER
jgi:ribosomal protein L10